MAQPRRQGSEEEEARRKKRGGGSEDERTLIDECGMGFGFRSSTLAVAMTRKGSACIKVTLAVRRNIDRKAWHPLIDEFSKGKGWRP
jgi:hypothetical protein